MIVKSYSLILKDSGKVRICSYIKEVIVDRGVRSMCSCVGGISDSKIFRGRGGDNSDGFG